MPDVRRPFLALALALACCLTTLVQRVAASPRPRHTHSQRSRAHGGRSPHRQDASTAEGTPSAKSQGLADTRTAAPTRADAPVATADDGRATREQELAASTSQSVGRAGRGGRLLGGIPLLEGANRGVHSAGNANHFGTAELVAMLESATRDVAARFQGSFLTVGDLSRATGGRLKHHRSHRSGRDADVGFYYLDGDGAPFHAPGFVRVRADGTTVDGHRFDVARNWELLRSMMEFPGAKLQYVFLSRPIQSMLLDYAIAAGTSTELVERARDLMSHYARGHDNHFHVRIHCPDSDGMCVDREPPRSHHRSRSARSRGHGRVHVAVEAP